MFPRHRAVASAVPLLLAASLLAGPFPAEAAGAAGGPRPPDLLDAGGTRIALAKLRVTGSALYVPAPM